MCVCVCVCVCVSVREREGRRQGGETDRDRERQTGRQAGSRRTETEKGLEERGEERGGGTRGGGGNRTVEKEAGRVGERGREKMTDYQSIVTEKHNNRPGVHIYVTISIFQAF